MDCIVAPLYVTSDVSLRANTPIIFKAGEPNHITIKTKNIDKDDHTGILLGGHPGDGLPRYIGVLLEGTMNIVAPFDSESATKVLEQLGIDFKNEAFTITQEETKLAPGQTPNRPLLGRALQREIAADDGNITIAIHIKRKIKAASTSTTPTTPDDTPVTPPQTITTPTIPDDKSATNTSVTPDISKNSTLSTTVTPPVTTKESFLEIIGKLSSLRTNNDLDKFIKDKKITIENPKAKLYNRKFQVLEKINQQDGFNQFKIGLSTEKPFSKNQDEVIEYFDSLNPSL